MEFTADYTTRDFTAYANLGLEHAERKDIVSSQFQFDPGDLAYIEDHFIHLDYEQYLTASGAYRISSGKPRAYPPIFSTAQACGRTARCERRSPARLHAGESRPQPRFRYGQAGDLTARFDVTNLFDNKYEIRDGSGIGVGAPQSGRAAATSSAFRNRSLYR